MEKLYLFLHDLCFKIAVFGCKSNSWYYFWLDISNFFYEKTKESKYVAHITADHANISGWTLDDKGLTCSHNDNTDDCPDCRH